MPDIFSAMHLAAPELTLAIGALVLLVLGAFIGEKSARLISILSVALLIAGAGLFLVRDRAGFLGMLNFLTLWFRSCTKIAEAA